MRFRNEQISVPADSYFTARYLNGISCASSSIPCTFMFTDAIKDVPPPFPSTATGGCLLEYANRLVFINFILVMFTESGTLDNTIPFLPT